MSLTTKVLIALVLGLGVGIALAQSQSTALLGVVPILDPIGTLWVNAVRMTVIPLVVSSIVVGVASAPNDGTIGRVGGRALLIATTMLIVAAVFTVLVAKPLLDLVPVDPAAATALRGAASTATESASESIKKLPTLSQWVVDLVPTNPLKAAADGAMLPLIVFSVIFGLAITRIDTAGRSSLLGFFTAVSTASLTIVRWVLTLAPIGVFALSLSLAAKLGLSAAGALLGYVAVTSAVCVLFAALIVYPGTLLFARISLRDFARGAFPAQAVAFSARSSLASLPAMMESARDRLKLPEPVTTFFLPLAASTFRVGASLGVTTGVLFIARLFAVELSLSQLSTIVVTVVLTSFSIPGIPGGSIIVMVPSLLAAGLPVEGMGILLGVDTIPDMFRTTSNVTGDMSAATILGRWESPKATKT